MTNQLSETTNWNHNLANELLASFSSRHSQIFRTPFWYRLRDLQTNFHIKSLLLSLEFLKVWVIQVNIPFLVYLSKIQVLIRYLIVFLQIGHSQHHRPGRFKMAACMCLGRQIWIIFLRISVYAYAFPPVKLHAIPLYVWFDYTRVAFHQTVVCLCQFNARFLSFQSSFFPENF